LPDPAGRPTIAARILAGRVRAGFVAGGPMPRAVVAGVAYFAAVFAAGVVLGILRNTVVAPATGRLAAVAIELPLILSVSAAACAVLVRRLAVPAAPAPRLVMGAVAFALLMAAELALSVFLVGRSPAAHLALYGRADQLLGLAGQIVFALMPLALLSLRPAR
jgi:hypothetical protein